MHFQWPLDSDTMIWLQIAIGFMGALTLVRVRRWLGNLFGQAFDIRAHFSPKGGCQQAIVEEINKARREILVQAYSFTADPITYGLVEAKKRGINVEVLLDRSNEAERYSDLKILLDKGLDPLIDAEHAIAHNKIIIIDQRILITGSYNFTNQAEGENAENLVVIKGRPDLIRQYRENFLHHKTHCKPAQLKAETKDRRAA